MALEGVGGARWRHLSHPAQSAPARRPGSQVTLRKLRHDLGFPVKRQGIPHKEGSSGPNWSEHAFVIVLITSGLL